MIKFPSEIEKKWDEIKKKFSPLKLLSQSQPNFDEMILVWSPFKIVFFSAVQLGGHLGWKSGSPDTILERGHPRIIPQKFGCN
jgi:hypothetical protein